MTNHNKIILDLCGGTGAWSQPYVDAGYDVRNITLPDNDVRTYQPPDNVYGILAAPPCTMFSFARTNAKTPRNLIEGMEIVQACLEIIWSCQYGITNDNQKYSPLKFWAVENPFYGMLAWFLAAPKFTFDPYEFGDNYKKRTALWGIFNEPKIQISLSFEDKKELDKCKTNARALPKFEDIRSKEIHPEKFGVLDRAARRSITPSGFAKAFFEANK